MSEEYINTKVRPILELLLDSLLDSTPEDPIPFMYTWLLNYNNQKSKERIELETLREQIKLYKNEEGSPLDIKDNRCSFMNTNMKIINHTEDKKLENKNYSSDSEEEENIGIINIEERRQKLAEKGQRAGISAEAFGRFNKKRTFKPRIIKKTDSQKKKIKERCLTSFLFNNFDDVEISTIVDALEEKHYKKDDYIIKQGDSGDYVYIIEKGELICEKVFNKGDPPTYLKTYKEGELFGELALLYNAPRAATIYAKTDCVLWALDRLTFNSIVKESAINKREKYKKFLETIPLLSTVESYELYSICDAIKTEKFEKNQYIIKEGEQGDKFFILDEGEAVATKENMNFKKQYIKGDYFGELALLRNAPRAASVMAVTDCKVLTLDRPAFKRLLGPLEDILKRNSEAYEKYAKA
jgi:cAMP-dependent protein kinase regulator